MQQDTIKSGNSSRSFCAARKNVDDGKDQRLGLRTPHCPWLPRLSPASRLASGHGERAHPHTIGVVQGMLCSRDPLSVNKRRQISLLLPHQVLWLLQGLCNCVAPCALVLV